MNYNLLRERANVIVDGATEETIVQRERELGVTFPDDYKELLRFSDGCMVVAPLFVVFFSVGEGFHEKETLKFVNSLMSNSEMYFIGRFAGEMFGYLKGSDDHRIYSYFEETGEKILVAENVDELVQKYVLTPTV